jgi:hypothetical protein
MGSPNLPAEFRPHRGSLREDFKVSREQVGEVLKEIDDGWRNKKPVAFYDLEGTFDSPQRPRSNGDSVRMSASGPDKPCTSA